MPEFYNLTRAQQRQHGRDHQARQFTREAYYCRACYPDTPVTSERFTNFWTWINQNHYARSYNGYTKAAFETFNTIILDPTSQLIDLSHAAICIIQSIRFTRTTTPIIELCYYFHALFDLTHGYRDPPTPDFCNQVHQRYLNFGTPVNMAATGADITAALQGVFGQNGNNVRAEGSVVKIEIFQGKKTEDPVSWLAAFNRATDTNKWADDRRVKIAAGFLRGEAAEWFDGKRNDIGDHWTANTNGGNNFTDLYNAQYVTEQRKNEWFYKLMNLRQKDDETVDSFAAKYLKLIKRADITDQAQKKRMFLHGIRPTLIPFVQLNNPNTLQDAIDVARRTEAGFNLSSSKSSGTPLASSSKETKEETKKDDEISNLTQQLQQLTLNYANLTSAFMAQAGGSNPRGNNNTNYNNSYNRTASIPNQPPRRNTRDLSDVTCYRCRRPGHYARECTFQCSARGGNNIRGRGGRGARQTRFVLPTTNTRSLNYVDAYYEDEYDEGYYDEYDNYYSEAEAYPAHTLRSGNSYKSSPYPSKAQSKGKRATKRSESQIEDQLRYDNYDSSEVEDIDMEEAETEEETEEEVSEPEPLKKTKKSVAKTIAVPKKIKRKLQPAPIEQVTEFDVAKYISNLSSGLSIGQAAHLIPKYRSGLAASVRRTRNKNKEANANYVDASEHRTTAMKCEILVGREAVTAIVDSGAATSIITKPLMKELGYKPDKPSNLMIVTANGQRTKALGEVSDLPINVNYLKIPTNVQVLESKDKVLILGNDWLKRIRASIDWHEQTMTIHYKGRRERIPITCINEELVPPTQDNYEDDEEYEQNDWEENYIYYSGISDSSEDDLEYNPWAIEEQSEEEDEAIDNPAIYLAESERSNN